MFRIRTFNQISVRGLERFSRECYEVASEIGHPDAILLRSHKLAEAEIGESVKAIARAGAGYNNIPVGACTARGIPVFNTPGANANAVKELVAAALLLASRGIVDGIAFVNSLSAEMPAAEMSALLEKEKKRFAGNELRGKTLGVVGLGAIGSKVARLGLGLGMEVIGYDPALSVEAAWRLPSEVRRMENLGSLFQRADFVTLHLPVLESTRNLVNAETITALRKEAVCSTSRVTRSSTSMPWCRRWIRDAWRATSPISRIRGCSVARTCCRCRTSAPAPGRRRRTAR